MHIEVDYRKFRLSRLNTDQFRHLKLLLFWPVFGMFFLFVERLRPAAHYHVIHCVLDDLIPFCEYFLIPYLLWFLALGGMLLYTLLFDVRSFRRFMTFVILTYSATMVIYLLYPTCQELRPESFVRDNVFTRFIGWYYVFDTNTNVCPSLHVIGAAAVMFTAWHAKGLSGRAGRIVFTVLAVLISASTVFLKQHSILDVAAAVPLCIVGYCLAFSGPAEPAGVRADVKRKRRAGLRTKRRTIRT